MFSVILPGSSSGIFLRCMVVTVFTTPPSYVRAEGLCREVLHWLPFLVKRSAIFSKAGSSLWSEDSPYDDIPNDFGRDPPEVSAFASQVCMFLKVKPPRLLICPLQECLADFLFLPPSGSRRLMFFFCRFLPSIHPDFFGGVRLFGPPFPETVDRSPVFGLRPFSKASGPAREWIFSCPLSFPLWPLPAICPP